MQEIAYTPEAKDAPDVSAYLSGWAPKGNLPTTKQGLSKLKCWSI